MVNKVTLIGNIGLDPEVKQLDGGIELAKMRIATNETYRNGKGEKVENTEWHTITCRNSLATYAKNYVKKGMRIYVEGKLHTDNWEDERGKHSATVVRVSTLKIMDKKPAGVPEEVNMPGNESNA